MRASVRNAVDFRKRHRLKPGLHTRHRESLEEIARAIFILPKLVVMLNVSYMSTRLKA